MILAIGDVVAMMCVVAFYWRVVVTLRQSVAKDSGRSQRESMVTARKKLLQRAFGLISISYFVFYLPMTVAFPIREYFAQVFDQAPVPVGKITIIPKTLYSTLPPLPRSAVYDP